MPKLNLPVNRLVSHISPSSLLKWMNCEFNIYLQRLVGHPFIEEPLSEALIFGNSFDAKVKSYIAEKLKIPEIDILKKQLNYKINKAINSAHTEELKQLLIAAAKEGIKIAEFYIAAGLADRLLVRRSEIYIDKELYSFNGAFPILGQVDLIVDGIPLDWKTRGFYPAKQSYPYSGYYSIAKLSKENGNRIQTDPVVFPGEKYYLEQLNPNWMIQMVFYNWLLNNRPDHTYIIEEICGCGNEVIVVQHKDQISQKFKDYVHGLLEQMWNAIHERMFFATIEEPSPSIQRCERYDSICDVAHLCKYYLNTLGNKERRSEYV